MAHILILFKRTLIHMTMKPTTCIKKNLQIKKIFYLSLIMPFILFSCEKTPDAHFFTDTVEPEVGQDVYFTNDSHNANRFEWDFGDGYESSEAEPVHYYTATGTFEVVLTAYSRSGLSDQASITIDVKIPTLLEIEVVEWYDEYVVEDASVRLYPTLIDWEEETNLETEGFTDEDGFVVFSHLGPWIYYVDVWEEHHDNYTLKQEDVGFIRTPEIMPNKINRFIAWVDYYADHTKGDNKRGKPMVIKRIERKTTDKTIPGSETDDWKVLYDKSIKLK